MVELIGVTGPSCSGKSTVCREMEQRDEARRFSLDNFYRPEKELENNNYDHPNAVKFEQAYRALKDLKKGKEVVVPEFDKVNNEVVGEKTFEPFPLILVDGFMVLYHDKIREILDKSIFLDIPKQEQLRRRKKRFREGGLYADEDYFHETVYPAYKKYIEPTKEYADHVIDADKEPEEVIEEVLNKLEV